VEDVLVIVEALIQMKVNVIVMVDKNLSVILVVEERVEEVNL
jgi:hypothetical protein